MKTLITGCSGYIGSYLKTTYDDNQTEYIGSDSKSFDYGNIDSIREFFKGKNIGKVIHLAGTVQNDDYVNLFKVNVYGIYNLLLVCSENKVSHFAFASGNNVYDNTQVMPLAETSLRMPDPQNRYGFSKYAGELIIQDMCSNLGIKYANIRIADVYGPGQKHGNLIKAIVNNVREGKPLCLYGKGLRTRDYTYVKDVANGLYFISSNELTGNINLGTSVGTSVRELLEIVKNICGGNIIINQVAVDKEDTSSVVLNCNKLYNLGFRMKYSIIDGMTEILKGENNEQ